MRSLSNNYKIMAPIAVVGLIGFGLAPQYSQSLVVVPLFVFQCYCHWQHWYPGSGNWVTKSLQAPHAPVGWKWDFSLGNLGRGASSGRCRWSPSGVLGLGKLRRFDVHSSDAGSISPADIFFSMMQD